MSDKGTDTKQTRRVLITGGARGIGYATARLFAEDGARLALCDLDLTEAGKSASILRDDGHDVHAYAMDVTNEEQVSASVQQALDHLGSLDVVIHSAGTAASGSFLLDTPALEVYQQLQIHAMGSFLLTQAVLPALRESQGDLVLISSAAGSVPMKTGVSYSMAKSAEETLGVVVAMEERRNNVRCNIVCPGFFATRLGHEVNAQIAARNPAATVPMGDPADVARLIAELVANDDPSATGIRHYIGVDREVIENALQGRLYQFA